MMLSPLLSFAVQCSKLWMNFRVRGNLLLRVADLVHSLRIISPHKAHLAATEPGDVVTKPGKASCLMECN
jgi:hypothetical protein